MKQAMVEVEKIKKLQEIARKTQSDIHRRDCYKKIRYLLGELEFYCKHKGLDYNQITKDIKLKR